MEQQLHSTFLLLKSADKKEEVVRLENQILNMTYKLFAARITSYVAPKVYNKDRDVVKKIVADTFVNYYKRIKKREFDSETFLVHVRRFLFMTAKGKVFNHSRDQQKLTSLSSTDRKGTRLEDRISDTDGDPVQSMMRRQAIREWGPVIESALETMNRRYANAIRFLITFEGKPTAEDIRDFMTNNHISSLKQYRALIYNAKINLRDKIPALARQLQIIAHKRKIMRRSKKTKSDE